MIEVYDNLIDSDISNDIEKIILNSNFPFFYSKLTVNDEDYESSKHRKDVKDGPQLTHNFLNHGRSSKNFSDIIPLVKEMSKIINHNIALLRVKANLKFNNNNLNKDHHNTPHIDREDDSYAILYFVNESDGDMFFFTEEKVKRVSPKKGRFVLFKSNISHCGQHPINSRVRCTINFNIII